MDNNEKLGWIERVDHASEEQAKRTLKFMILKCNTKTDTIARAIRDAIERHTPTPTIVYEQPESEDDSEDALASSHKKSSKKKKKKKEQDSSSQDEGDAPSMTSTKSRRTRRGDINADPLVGRLILKKSKTKPRRNKKRSSDHDEEQNSPDVSDKIKSKHASEPRAETKQRTCGESLETLSKQKSPPVIDLVTSSDDETGNTEQSKHGIVDDKSSDDDSSDDDSPDDSSSDSHSSDDGDSEDETHGDTVADRVGLPQESPNKDANEANARGDDTGRITTRPSTNSTANMSNQNSGTEIGIFGSGKKRKASERAVEEIRKDTGANSTIINHLNKRSKQNHPHESQRSPKDRTCRKCGVLFPSVAQLLKHQLYCKDSPEFPGGYHRSEPPSDDGSHQAKEAQKASHRAGDSFTDEPRKILQLPSRPRQTSQTDRGLSVPPPSFVHEPNNFPRGPTPTPLAIARSVSGIQSSPTGLIHRSEPNLSLDDSSGHQSPAPKPTTREQERYEEDRALRRCMYCKKWFRNCDNSNASCICHPGTCRSISCCLRCWI